jgi:exopolysaccharide/PEP-CTERM locus tyrosine autokinase
MNIVEKAAEKLKTMRPAPQEPPRVDITPDATPPTAASTIERLQERREPAITPAPDDTSLFHVDQMALKRVGYLPSDHDGEGQLRDELRRIKRPLLANVTGKSAKAPDHAERIVITSAGPGEGKTFTALNLAMSLAREPDHEVLLVDGDIPKFSLTRVFGLEERPGLMDVLEDEDRSPSSVIVRTDIPNLLVVPAGKRNPLTAELFGSRRMQDVLEEFGGRNRRRILLFDSSPLLATSESPVLVSYMGQVVVVVAASQTRQQALDASLECVNDSQYVGLILNMSQLPASENYYDHGYGY